MENRYQNQGYNTSLSTVLAVKVRVKIEQNRWNKINAIKGNHHFVTHEEGIMGLISPYRIMGTPQRRG
jgi:hypothetical protein